MRIPLDTQMDLVQVITYLDRDHYQHVTQLYNAFPDNVTASGLNSFLQQFNTWGQYLEHRRLVFVPYVLELSEKSNSGHNCKTCSGNCDAQHGIKLAEFMSLLQAMKSTLDEVNQTSFSIEHQAYIEEISKKLKDILNLEEIELLPRVMEAQRKINVIS